MARNRYFEDEQLNYKFDKSSLKKALKFTRPHKKMIITMIILMFVMCFVALLPPMLNAILIDNVISQTGLWGISWWQLAIIVLTLWGLIVTSDVVYTYFRTFYMAKVGHEIVADIRNEAYCNLQRLAFDYYDSRPAGKILVRVTSYLDNLANVFSSAVINVIVEGTKIILILALLFVLDWRLTLIVLAAIVPMAVIIFILRSSLSKRHRVMRNKTSNRTAYVAENIQGTFVTKAFNRGKLNTKIYLDLNKQANAAWRKVIHVNEAFFPTLDGFFYIGLLGVYAVSILLATSTLDMGGLSVGELIGFITYMGMFSGPINNIAAVLQQLASASADLERVFEVVDTPASIKDCETAYPLPQVKGAVKFENVTFAYDKGTNILENFNLDVPAGKMIALVGPTGAGKSTVINLLSRFYDVQEGTVSIDGHDVSKVQLYSLRTQVGVMMQDSFIFSGTIIENIRYARPEATDEQCISAAREVYADEFISKLPQGYYTKTSEQGAGLSTGERQLISFARVVLTNPQILILDEATSSIDTQTESLIKSALDKLLIGRTSFVIAHRLSTIRKADCILYIANKGIAEAGTHDELMNQKGKYYNLVAGHK